VLIFLHQFKEILIHHGIARAEFFYGNTDFNCFGAVSILINPVLACLVGETELIDIGFPIDLQIIPAGGQIRYSLPRNFTRKYRIDCSITQCSDNIVLKGEEVILLSDFRLKPPEKLMGLVKVNNEISVDFGFIVTFTEPNELTNKF
jgi:hypothetical protein